MHSLQSVWVGLSKECDFYSNSLSALPEGLFCLPYFCYLYVKRCLYGKTDNVGCWRRYGDKHV